MSRTHPDRSPNEPVIIDRNDRETGLKNGSIGVIMTERSGRVAYFPGKSGQPPLRFELSQLPGERNSAWAMTVHPVSRWIARAAPMWSGWEWVRTMREISEGLRPQDRI